MTGTLQDRTNTARQVQPALPTGKVFARRNKDALSTVAVEEDLEPHEQQGKAPPAPHQPAATALDKPHGHKAPASAEYTWLGLSKRRVSCVLPPSLPHAEAAARRQRQGRRADAKDGGRQKAEELKALIQEMSSMYREVDEFQLVEESPAKPRVHHHYKPPRAGTSTFRAAAATAPPAAAAAAAAAATAAPASITAGPISAQERFGTPAASAAPGPVATSSRLSACTPASAPGHIKPLATGPTPSVARPDCPAAAPPPQPTPADAATTSSLSAATPVASSRVCLGSMPLGLAALQSMLPSATPLSLHPSTPGPAPRSSGLPEHGMQHQAAAQPALGAAAGSARVPGLSSDPALLSIAEDEEGEELPVFRRSSSVTATAAGGPAAVSAGQTPGSSGMPAAAAATPRAGSGGAWPLSGEIPMPAGSSASSVTEAMMDVDGEEDAPAVVAAHGGSASKSACSETSPKASAGSAGSVASPTAAPEVQLTPLQQLLAICGQDVDPDCIPSMEALLGSLGDLRRMAKIGEGSYGEAFKQGSTVYKIVPIEGQQPINGYPQKKAADMTGEALVALALSGLRRTEDSEGNACANMAPCFVNTSKVAICHGPYPRVLAKAWHKWDEQHGSENDPVDGPGLGPGSPSARSQLYLVLAMEDSGRDLEKHVLTKGMEEARAILLQAAFTLAVGEAALSFEHRDMHWGNLLLRPAPAAALSFRLEGHNFRVQACGVQVSLIDFTTSRLVTEDGRLAFCDLSQDPEVFQGPEGEIQFDTYRRMQQLTGDVWSVSCPATNCLWMAYLAEVLAAHKLAKGGQAGTAHRRQLREFRDRCTRYASCKEMVLWDELFAGLWARV